MTCPPSEDCKLSDFTPKEKVYFFIILGVCLCVVVFFLWAAIEIMDALIIDKGM